ncbi:MAG TPA: FkbM family methyltransferase [Limnobacter sp.]|uniref:FkbM family methyltransferase n=1 Tax=Limnobacter sp. TaxID=2003368 RepID=UPI002ED7B033
MNVLLRKLKNFVRREILRDPFLLTAKRWFKDQGDTTLRVNYPLNAQSVVWDVGGYKGDFAHEIHSRYGCKVYLFEPVPHFYAHCVERFKNNPSIVCLQYGLSNADGEFEITDTGDASSFVRLGENNAAYKAQLRDASAVFHALGDPEVDLIKVNVEGGEFFIFPSLIEHGLMPKFNHLQIQFHNFVPNAVEQRQSIRQSFSKTHREDWNYEFVWEGWSRK